MTSEQAELLVDCRNTLGEMPLWHAQASTLYWIDIFKPGRVYFWEQQTGRVDFWQFDELVTSVKLCASGDLLIALTSDIVRFSPLTEVRTPVFSMTTANPKCRFNDGACDALGRFWIGSMPNNISEDASETETLPATGGIYRITDGGAGQFFAEQFACPNAICWNPDATKLYVADSTRGWIYSYRFDLQLGMLGERREFCRFDEFGIPDGAAVDRDGYIWNARWGAGVVLRISPDGRIDRVLRMPTTNPTACAFGAADLKTLYITTARCGLTKAQLEQEPLAGAVFSVTVEVPGLTVPTFGKR